MAKFAVSISACRMERSASVSRHTVGMVQAVSEAEAVGLGYQIGQKFYPPRSGWRLDVVSCPESGMMTLEGAGPMPGADD